MDPASIERGMIIGDVHGCIDELRDLLTTHGKNRQPIFVGDLVAKGPDSQAVVQLAREADAPCVRGNHEGHVLRWRAERKVKRPKAPLRPEHQQVVDTLREPDWAYLEALPCFVRLPQWNTIVVHAGMVPGVPPESQREYDMMNMRAIADDGTAVKQRSQGDPWAHLWRGPEHLVFGHDAVTGLQEHEFATGLDTGCVYGHALSALLMPEREIVSVPAAKMYCDPFEWKKGYEKQP